MTAKGLTRRHVLALLGAGLPLAVACSTSGDSSTSAESPVPAAASSVPEALAADRGYFPPATGDWEATDAAAAGFTSEGLDAVAAVVESRNSVALVMVSGGRILREDYWRGATEKTPHALASVQKSVTSILVGLATERGLLSIADPVSDYLDAGWSNAPPDDEAAITLRDLLTMTSGLDPATLRRAYAPGMHWEYNTTAYQKLRPVLEAASGDDINTISRDWLWEPTGTSDAAQWVERPGAGEASVDPTGARLWSLAMPARDLVRFGLLVQRDGWWGDDEVITDHEYLRDSLRPSQDLNGGYGYLWWLNTKAAPSISRGAPSDLVAARGAGDQRCYVCPSLDLVAVRLGDPAGDTFDNDLWRAIMAGRV